MGDFDSLIKCWTEDNGLENWFNDFPDIGTGEDAAASSLRQVVAVTNTGTDVQIKPEDTGIIMGEDPQLVLPSFEYSYGSLQQAVANTGTAAEVKSEDTGMAMGFDSLVSWTEENVMENWLNEFLDYPYTGTGEDAAGSFQLAVPVTNTGADVQIKSEDTGIDMVEVVEDPQPALPAPPPPTPQLQVGTKPKKVKVKSSTATGRKCQVDLEHPTRDVLLKFASFGKHPFDPASKLTPVQLKLVRPADKSITSKRLFSSERIASLPPKQQFTILRDRMYRRNRRINDNRLVFRAAYLEKLNESLKMQIQAFGEPHNQQYF